MIWIENILSIFRTQINIPKSFGEFHTICLCLVVLILGFLYLSIDESDEKDLKFLLAVYGFGSLFLEVVKQLIWSASYDASMNIILWDYPWYIFPFQLCTTPMIVSIVCLFLKDNKIKNALFSYMAFTTILGSIAVAIIPTDCFVSDLWVNIHAMWLHLGSLIISIYLIMSKTVKVNISNLKQGLIVFGCFALFANILNIVVYNSGILNGETFNMFYISPYFISSLPVFNTIQQNVPYLVFLFLYLFAISLGSVIIYCISKFLTKTKV